MSDKALHNWFLVYCLPKSVPRDLFDYLIWFNYLTFSSLKVVLFKSEPIFNDNDAQNNTNNVPFWYRIPV